MDQISLHVMRQLFKTLPTIGISGTLEVQQPGPMRRLETTHDALAPVLIKNFPNLLSYLLQQNSEDIVSRTGAS